MSDRSQCGYTDAHYKQLQILYDKYKDKGFMVLAFPCNQFGKQEPEKEEDIKRLIKEKYQVTFPLFEKINVNGSNQHPLYQFLKAQYEDDQSDISWNFEKFLCDRTGKPRQRLGPNVSPLDMEEDIAFLLEEQDL